MPIESIIPPLSERYHRPCASCIGLDTDRTLCACWILPGHEHAQQRYKYDSAGYNDIKCYYHMLSKEYLDFMDALMKARGENGPKPE